MGSNPPGNDAPGRITLHDFTHIKAPLTKEQETHLDELDVEYRGAQRDQQAPHTAVAQPAGLLNSGYSIPLVGLGTW
jgi:hypothetical protein